MMRSTQTMVCQIFIAAIIVGFGLASPVLHASSGSAAEALLKQMTLDEKIGQMVKVDSDALH